MTKNNKDRSLKACPFCGGKNIRTEATLEFFKVICGGCETEGPITKTKIEAQERWNARPELKIIEGREANLQEELGNAVAKIHELEQRPDVVRCSECQWRGKVQCPVWAYVEGQSFNDAVNNTDDDFYCADGKRSESHVEKK